MALMHSTQSERGFLAPDFFLRGADGKHYSLSSFSSAKGLLIVFMCNHCPYVVAVHPRLSALAREFAPKGIAVVGINSNDPEMKAADSYENMVVTAKKWNLPFPYLVDETQSVATAYGAVCTPDPYFFENQGDNFLLRYRGRIDDSWQDDSQVREHSLRLAIQDLLDEKPTKREQIASLGCSIKWKKT